ncbi:MAG: hypothetical protein RBR16_14325 [Syntrophus sp. (in: bacteria)]|nr:hypothetical protein [Syntrophus sp. (in: bacteria)]
MSKTIIDRSSILLGSGDVFVVDALSANYSNKESATTKANLLCRMDGIKIYTKTKNTITKQLVNGIVMDDDIFTTEMEFFLEFGAYEHNAKTQSVLFGGGVTDVSLALGSMMASRKNLRFEVKFTYPIGDKFMWYIFPKCKSVSDFEFNPGDNEGFKSKGIFRALPAVNENVIWYEATTPAFNNYIV